MSDRCLLMRTFSALEVHPLYSILHLEHAIKYIMFLELQFMKLLIENGGRLGSLIEENVFVTFVKLHARHTECPHLWNPVVLNQVCCFFGFWKWGRRD